MDAAQVGVGLGDIAGDVLRPFGLDVAVEVQIQPAVDDLPIARIPVELLAERRAIGAKAAKSWLVFGGVGLERIEMRLAHEAVGPRRHGLRRKRQSRARAVLG